MPDPEPREDDQKAVLAKKQNVTQSGLGLQQWGDDAQPEGEGEGTAGSGTAARQAKIGRNQTKTR